MSLTVQDESADGTTPPHDAYAEQVALGAGLLSRTALEEVAEIVTPADFYRPAHVTVFHAALEMVDAGQPVDMVTLAAELNRRGDLHRVGGAPYLHTLTEAVPAVVNGGYYAGLVATMSARRRLVEAAARIAHLGHVGDGDVSELQQRAWEATEQATATSAHGDEAVAFAELIPELVETLENGTDDRGTVQPPYADLRRLVPAFRPGQLITIGARPGVGKTVVGTDTARHAAAAGVAVVFFSLEMTRTELGNRIFAANAQINLARFADAAEPLSESEWDRLAAHVGDLSRLPLVVDDAPACSLAHIRARLRGMARSPTGPAGLVIIDYLQLMTMPRADTREQQIAATSRGLKLLAREYNIPIVVLAQLNRSVETRADKMPQLSDFRESGAVEQDSNIALMLHRPEVDDPHSQRAGELDIRVAKNRAGPIGVETVVAQMHYARCVDLAHPQ